MKRFLSKFWAVVLAFTLVMSVAFVAEPVYVSAEEFELPESVDNSTSPYFPAVGNQGSMGSCTSWAHVYYSFTYAMNKARGIKTTPENTFSPQWSFNLTSNGEGDGSTSIDIEYFLEQQGGVPLSMVPYEEDPVTWCRELNVWRESINNRLSETIKYLNLGQDSSRITSADDTDLISVKAALAQGEILTFSTFINSWKITDLKNNPDAPGNKDFVNEKSVYAQIGSNGSHAMTIVGYNDNIWTDCNFNDKVDPGEMGAFKIANSWGEGYANDGFIWAAYDALNRSSSVEGVVDPGGRSRFADGIEGVVVRPYGEGSDVYIRYNFKADNRRQTYIEITAEKDGNRHTYKAFYPKLTLTSGSKVIPYDGNMLIALDNVIPDINAENFSDYTWSVKFADKTEDGLRTTFNNAEFVIESTGEVFKAENTFPITLDGSSKEITFTESELNHAVVYYTGHYSPFINYQLSGAEWSDSLFMDPSTEREGYVNKFVIDLGDKDSAKVYFSDANGKCDNNSGKYYEVKRGLNYFVTQGVAEPLKAEISLAGSKVERNRTEDFIAEASGGYAPYKYQYQVFDLSTGEQIYCSEDKLDNNQLSRVFNDMGRYGVKVTVTDFTGVKAEDMIELEVVDAPFSFSEFRVINSGELNVGDSVNIRAVTDCENIRHMSPQKESYNFKVVKDGVIVYEAVIDPDESSPKYMTSTRTATFVPKEPGRYTATIYGNDFRKEYAEISVDFAVVNKAYVYYRGYSSPMICSSFDGKAWSEPAKMEQSNALLGYVNVYTVDLGKNSSALVYFTDATGNTDDNNGSYFEIKTGENKFVTENAVEELSVKLDSSVKTAETGKVVAFTPEIQGGYAPYSYMFTVENLITGETTYSSNLSNGETFEKAFDTEGGYRVYAYVTDYANTQAQAQTEIMIITPTEAPVTATQPQSTCETTASAATESEPSESYTATADETESTAINDEPETSTQQNLPTEASEIAEGTECSTPDEVTLPTEIYEELVGIIGDVNGDETVSIKDVTLIQKHIAKLSTGIEIVLGITDCTKDGSVNIKDATVIQKYLAKFDVEYVGEELKNKLVVTLPVPTTAEQTTATADEATSSVETVAEATTSQLATALHTEAVTTQMPAIAETTTTAPTTEATEAKTQPQQTETVPETEPAEITTAQITEVVTEVTTAAYTEEVTEEATEEVTEEVTEVVTEPESHIVVFTNSLRWSGGINCYYWSDSDATMTSWPGVAVSLKEVNNYGEDVYEIELPQNVQYVIFSNGTYQTVDIPLSVGEERYYALPTTDSSGHYLVDIW